MDNSMEKKRKAAYVYIVNKGHTQKETARLLDVSERTLSLWAKKGGWKEIRVARQTTADATEDNIRSIVGILAEKRLRLEDDIRQAKQDGDKDLELELRGQAASISDQIAKYNKYLRDNDRKNRATLDIYIEVMDDIFSRLRAYDSDLFQRTVPFQEQLVKDKMEELG